MVLLAITCMISACTGWHNRGKVIAQNEAFVLTGDSLIEGNIIATASTDNFIESSLTRERLDSIVRLYALSAGHDRALPVFVGGKPWHSTENHDEYVQYKSPQRLVNALHRMSIDHIAEASTGDTFDAQGDTVALYCAIYLSLAHINPARSMATLRNLVHGNEVTPCNGWPASGTRLAWAIAAWEVYLATADQQWLTFVHNVLASTLNTDCHLLQNRDTHLMHGYAGNQLQEFYPSWMGDIDKVENMPLLTSAITMRAMEILDEIDEELGFNHQHGYDATRLESAINQQLWSERRGRYAAYLYGNPYVLRAPIIDNLAQPLSVIWGIADDDRAATLINKTPLTLLGVPVIFPWASIVEPYFTHPSWSAIQALWTIAAMTVGNDDMVRLGIASLYRVQALFQSRHITIQGEPRNDLLTAASNQAILLRVLAGITYLPDGIEINPYIPECFPGDKTIKGLHVKKATIDITISGTGNNVQTIEIDGEPVDGTFIPSTLTGHHKVSIQVTKGHTTHGVTVATTGISLPPPPDVVWTADSGYITDYVTGGRYMMLNNGRFNFSVGDIAFAIPESKSNIEISAARANKYGFGFIARPHLFVRNWMQEIGLGVQLDSLDFHIVTEHAGQYLMQMYYTNQGNTDAMMVNINSHHQGSFIMPSGSDTLSTNMLTVRLLRGRNHVVMQRPGNILQTANPINLRIIKQ